MKKIPGMIMKKRDWVFFFLIAFSTFSFLGHERGNPRRERPVSHSSSSTQLHCQGNNLWMCAFQTELHIGLTDTIWQWFMVLQYNLKYGAGPRQATLSAQFLRVEPRSQVLTALCGILQISEMIRCTCKATHTTPLACKHRFSAIKQQRKPNVHWCFIVAIF